MPAHALQLDLPDTGSAGHWPLLIACCAAAGVALLLVERLQSIPARLADEAASFVSSTGISGLALSISGRDLTVSGEVAPDVDRNALVAGLANIEGMRQVSEAISVIDPAARRQAALDSFRTQLKAIDTSIVAFEPGSALLAASSDTSLEALLALMSQHPDFRIRVAGHTDDTGSTAVNLRISRERAGSVARWLITRGVARGRVIATGYGSTQPVADNATESGRARNRRIEISYVD